MVTGWEPDAGRGAPLLWDSLAFFLALMMSSAVRGRVDWLLQWHKLVGVQLAPMAVW